MNKLIRMTALLACAAAFSLPLAASAQSDAPPAAGHRHHQDPFMRALHTLALSGSQKAQIKGFISADRQANQGASPDQRKVNREQLHQQIRGVLSPQQQQQLDAELAK